MHVSVSPRDLPGSNQSTVVQTLRMASPPIESQMPFPSLASQSPANPVALTGLQILTRCPQAPCFSIWPGSLTPFHLLWPMPLRHLLASSSLSPPSPHHILVCSTESLLNEPLSPGLGTLSELPQPSVYPYRHIHLTGLDLPGHLCSPLLGKGHLKCSFCSILKWSQQVTLEKLS